MKTHPLVSLTTLALLLAGCGKPQSNDTGRATDSGPAPELAAVFVAEAPAGAGAIHQLRSAAAPGAELVLSGRIMGAADPFVQGRAAFILGDPELLTPCNERPDDNCPTPWDTCCDTREAKRLGTATIQVLGPDGRVLRTGLEGVGGLEKLSRVVVKGRVAEGAGPDALVVNATAIHVSQ